MAQHRIFRMSRSSLFWCGLLLSGCTSQPVDPLPKESQSGQDMIACRINGDVWLPYSAFDWSLKGKRNRIARYSPKSKTLYVGGSNSKDGRQVSFSLINCRGEGTYSLMDSCADLVRPTANCGVFSPSGYLSAESYLTDQVNKGEVVITKLTEHIVAGRFSFAAFNLKTGRSVQITEGRFDFYYTAGVDD